jgi:hypothetical protein
MPIEKFCSIIGMSPLIVMRMIEEGKIKAHFVNGKPLIDFDSFFELRNEAIAARPKKKDLFG